MSFSTLPVSWLSMVVGRFLLGLYFFLPGITKITAHAETLAYMEGHNIPMAAQLIWVATVANLIGGLLLMTGRHVKLAALGSALYIVLVNVMLHDFWTMSGEEAAREGQNFVKNLAILAGLLVLAGHAQTRPLSFSGWWRSDRVAAAP